MNINITGIGSEFQGVGRIEDGRAAFIPGALIGECVQASICKNAERFVECRLEQVISPAPVRIQPPCALSGRCGGCKAQHVEYTAALEMKTQIVRQNIERIGSLSDVDVRLAKGSVNPWRYRNKGESAISFDKKTKKIVIGSSEAGSHKEEMKKNGKVVLLTAQPETILERVKDDDNRPLLKGNKNLEFIQDLMEKRREKYEAAADIMLAVDGKCVQDICSEMMELLGMENTLKEKR